MHPESWEDPVSVCVCVCARARARADVRNIHKEAHQSEILLLTREAPVLSSPRCYVGYLTMLYLDCEASYDE
jgi:hypothetical protein